MIETKNITMRFRGKTIFAMEKMMMDTGSASISEVVRRCIINEYYRIYKVMPEDIVPERQARESTKITKEEKKVISKEALCERLDGKVVDKGGLKTCHFHIYEMINPQHVERYEQVVPLDMINEETVATQYTPNKADCLKVLTK